MHSLPYERMHTYHNIVRATVAVEALLSTDHFGVTAYSIHRRCRKIGKNVFLQRDETGVSGGQLLIEYATFITCNFVWRQKVKLKKAFFVPSTCQNAFFKALVALYTTNASIVLLKKSLGIRFCIRDCRLGV